MKQKPQIKSVLIATIAIVLAIATQSINGHTTESSSSEENASTTNQPSTNSNNASANGQIDQLDQYKSYVYTWKINAISELAFQNDLSLESPLFPAFGYSYQAKTKLKIKNGGTYVSLAFVDDDNAGLNIPLKVLPEVTYTLRDLNGTGMDIVRSLEYELLSTFNFNQLYYEKQLCDPSDLVDSVYYSSDSIAIDIAIAPPSVANAIASTDGVLAVEIDSYSTRRQRQINVLDYFCPSPYFYTAPGGYRVKVAMHLNYYLSNGGVGLSAEVMFLTGKNDENLGLSYPHTTTIILFNQLDSTNHFVKTVQKDLKTESDYFVDLLSNDHLENSGFLVDDILYYKVIVQPIGN